MAGKVNAKTTETGNFDLFGTPEVKDVLLRDRFVEPPFTILDTKSGPWQQRKKAWKAKGIKSEVSRENVKVINNSFDGAKYGRESMPEVSIFDPALAELMYRWFCPDGGKILDPFSGGSVRGIVASYLGYKYTGIDVRPEQIDSNREQALEICPIDNQPQYYAGDSNVVLDDPWSYQFDLVFTCPPYGDLEVYSDLPGDISNKSLEEFNELYTSILVKSCEKLKRGGFAVLVVGDYRDKEGYYVDFLQTTKEALKKGGTRYYNDLILAQPLGTAMLRAPRVFEASKKVTKVHENVLVFRKP